ncbi:unnamed protein product [Linum tenue]|jgi:hypothetical protein
MSDT